MGQGLFLTISSKGNRYERIVRRYGELTPAALKGGLKNSTGECDIMRAYIEYIIKDKNNQVIERGEIESGWGLLLARSALRILLIAKAIKDIIWRRGER